MSTPLLWVALGVLALIVGIVLEGKRQERKYGKPEGRSLIGAGMLELQRHLEPQNKVEHLMREQEESEESDSGDPPVPVAEPGSPRRAMMESPPGGAGPSGGDDAG